MACHFCYPNLKDILYEGDTVYVYRNGYPVNPGHSLVIPKRHINNLGDLTGREVAEIKKVINQRIKEIKTEHNPDGFNIGLNLGEAAGQTIPHLHIHVIPRYKGDVENPRGGVRGVIPSKQSY